MIYMMLGSVDWDHMGRQRPCKKHGLVHTWTDMRVHLKAYTVKYMHSIHNMRITAERSRPVYRPIFWYLYDPVCKFLCSSWADAFLTLAGLRHCRRHWWRLQKWQTSGTHTYTHTYTHRYIYIYLESGRERERERDMPFFIMSSLSFGRIVQRRK